MPIRYSVSHDGHFIHAVASGLVTWQEFVDFELKHAIDERIIPPVSELLEIEHDALNLITLADIAKVIKQRKKQIKPPIPHRCAIVVSLSDDHSWNLARFYEGMVNLHYPVSVIVFGNPAIARTWLGINEAQINKPDTKVNHLSH